MDIRHKHEPPINKDATPHCKLSAHTHVMNAWSVFNLLLQYHHGGPLGGYSQQRYGSEMQYHLMGDQPAICSHINFKEQWRMAHHQPSSSGKKQTQAPGTWECKTLNAAFLSSAHIGIKNQRRVDSIRLNAVYIMNTFWIWMDDFSSISIGVKFKLADRNGCLLSRSIYENTATCTPISIHQCRLDGREWLQVMIDAVSKYHSHTTTPINKMYASSRIDMYGYCTRLQTKMSTTRQSKQPCRY
ncbi:predicted protein [Lichtheimia corymbifera JMRC:FSU:9682]|uniref:Uncharacterized protein n=1 Tax=Lichtheimia corymbifera JMRC:FSU:9682 TaxID=1263082 RepID=A0A068SH80_9FUNG|nr:predicted protein [Lichtheimia corymbifera JMRC:FSU:9682]